MKSDDGRHALVLESTVFHPQGGGQPSDTGVVTVANSDVKFIVQDVRSKDGIVRYYDSLNTPFLIEIWVYFLFV